MKGYVLLLFNVLVIASYFSCGRSPVVYVEHYRKKNLADEKVIQKAIDAAGEGGVISFEPNRTYNIGGAILLKKFQTLLGNNATLRRADQSVAKLSSSVSSEQDEIYVQEVPEDWSVGDQLQLCTDSSAAHSNQFLDLPNLPNIIVGIHDLGIKLSSKVGRSLDGTIIEWPAGTYARKVFTILRGDSINLGSVPYRVANLNFDGNSRNNNLNHYWNVNSTIFIRGTGAKIEDCRFTDIPNENIVGQGMYITNCQAFRLNGSFVHLSGIDTIARWPQKHSFISGNFIDKVCLIPNSLTGHSEAAFTTSYNGGYASIIGNRVYNCGEAAIGLIEYHADTADGGKSDFIIMGNVFKNCRLTVYDIPKAPENGHASSNIFISNNIFSNCGVNDWRNLSYLDEFTGLDISNNDLTDGTKWILPDYMDPAKGRGKKIGHRRDVVGGSPN